MFQFSNLFFQRTITKLNYLVSFHACYFEVTKCIGQPSAWEKPYGMVANLTGRGCKCILSPQMAGRPRMTQGSQFKNCRDCFCLGVSKSKPSYQQTLRKGGTKQPLLSTINKPGIWSLPNLIEIMTGRKCYGQMRPKLKNIIDMFGGKMECTSYLLWNMVLSHLCFSDVLLPVVKGHYLRQGCPILSEKGWCRDGVVFVMAKWYDTWFC